MTDTAPPRVPLAMVKPDKPIGEMSPEERKAFARRIYEAIAKAHRATT